MELSHTTLEPERFIEPERFMNEFGKLVLSIHLPSGALRQHGSRTPAGRAIGSGEGAEMLVERVHLQASCVQRTMPLFGDQPGRLPNNESCAKKETTNSSAACDGACHGTASEVYIGNTFSFPKSVTVRKA